MPLEIERKFLVAEDGWRLGASPGQRLREGLLARMARGKVWVRRSEKQAWITVKGPKKGIARQEYEYEVPLDHADQMLATLCEGPILEKTRHRLDHEGLTWEVDVYAGALAGLVIAEVELEHLDQAVSLPAWIGREVTGNPDFSSASLINTVQATPGLTHLAGLR